MTTDTQPDLEINKVQRTSLSRKRFEGQDFRNSDFQDVNALNAVFERCDFSYSIFSRSYFRNAEFNKCKFIGCMFIDCNLNSTKMYVCDLSFARFQRTQLATREVLANLPPEPNKRRDLLQNLIVNAKEIGDVDIQRTLILLEIKASRDHHWKALVGSDSYHRDKYASWGAKVGALWNWVSINVSGWIWGNGEKPHRILLSGIVLLMALSAVNTTVVLPREATPFTSSALEALRYTSALFLDLSVDDRYRGYRWVDYCVAALRYVYVGLYVSVLFRIISRR